MNSPSPSPQKAANKSQESTQDTLYAARKKLYVRAVTGIFANWRWVLVWFPIVRTRSTTAKLARSFQSSDL